jgi:hypothetical protein
VYGRGREEHFRSGLCDFFFLTFHILQHIIRGGNPQIRGLIPQQQIRKFHRYASPQIAKNVLFRLGTPNFLYSIQN